MFGVGLGSCHVRILCSILLIPGIDYYTCREVFGSFTVHSISGLRIGGI